MDLEKTIEEHAPEESSEGGILYIISTPIGNDGDISLRALKSIRGSNLIVCEEGKIGARFLHKHSITQKMELLNENNEVEKTYELLDKLRAGKRISLVSDCGTPVLADPGLLLVQECIKNNIKVVAVPGASSIMTALVMSGFPINSFFYAGFMSREKSVRVQQITELAYNPHTVVLLETPYRLMPLLEAFLKIMPKRRAYIGCNLTMPFETHHYGTFSELYDKFAENKFKGEFAVVFEGNIDSSTILVPESSSVERAFSGERKKFDRNPTGRNYKSKDSYPAKGRKRFSNDEYITDEKPNYRKSDKPDGRANKSERPYKDRKPFSEDKRRDGNKRGDSKKYGNDSKKHGNDGKKYGGDSKRYDDKKKNEGRKPYKSSDKPAKRSPRPKK